MTGQRLRGLHFDGYNGRGACHCDEGLLRQYLETGMVDDSQIAQLVAERKAFPCYFGSALGLDGVDALLDGLERYLPAPQCSARTSVRVCSKSRG